MRQHLTEWALLVIRYTNIHHVHHVHHVYHVYFDNVARQICVGHEGPMGIAVMDPGGVDTNMNGPYHYAGSVTLPGCVIHYYVTRDW
jgi:hypothetical protein